MSQDVDVDLDAFTLGDIEDFEEASGVTFMQLHSALQNNDYTVLSGKVIKALAWIMKRHEDPDFTLQQARDVSLGDVDIGGNGQQPDQGASGDPSG